MLTAVGTPAAQHCTSRLTVPNAHGLHARPAALLVKATQGFDSHIQMECDGHCVNAKSILGIMSLGAKQGTLITMTAKGHDAVGAIRAIEGAFVYFYQERQAEVGMRGKRAVVPTPIEMAGHKP